MSFSLALVFLLRFFLPPHPPHLKSILIIGGQRTNAPNVHVHELVTGAKKPNKQTGRRIEQAYNVVLRGRMRTVRGAHVAYERETINGVNDGRKDGGGGTVPTEISGPG